MNSKTYVTTPYIIYNSVEKKLINIIDGGSSTPDDQTLRLLKRCLSPVEKTELVAEFGQDFFTNAVNFHYICPPDEVYRLHNIMLIEIGTTNYCNNTCLYCPVREHPVKTKKVMDMDLFRKLIQFAQQCSNPHLTLNFYNEPTYDPLFAERIEAIAATNLKYTLQTNGSGLDEKKLAQIVKYKKNLHQLIINFPSADPTTYQKMTGSPLTQRLLDNISRASKADIETQIVVIGTKEEIDAHIPAIRELFPCNVFPTQAHDVAGAVKNQYNKHVNLEGKLCGCPTVVQSFNISAFGDVFLCSRDFFQSNSIGNANEQELEEILSGKKAQRIREIVFGGCKGEYICRSCAYMQFFTKSSEYVQVKRLLEDGKDSTILK